MRCLTPEPEHRPLDTRDRDIWAETLAMRLLAAYLCDDPDERAFYVWAVMDESGLSREQFQIAARTAREAASWWIDSGIAAEGRERILAKLEAITGSAA